MIPPVQIFNPCFVYASDSDKKNRNVACKFFQPIKDCADYREKFISVIGNPAAKYAYYFVKKLKKHCEDPSSL
jgi:hypothetical protein